MGTKEIIKFVFIHQKLKVFWENSTEYVSTFYISSDGITY